MNTPKAVFFDLDETLIENKIPVPHLFASVFSEFGNRLGIEDIEAFRQVFRDQIAGLWESMFEVDISPEQQVTDCFTNAVQTVAGLSQNHATEMGETMLQRYLDLAGSSVVFHEGSVEVLAWLREQGITTGLITNGIEAFQRSKIDALRVHELVDHVTISAQARAHKPHPPVFSLALERAKVSANEAWHVGDHVTNDVAGAIRHGMTGVFYNPKGLNVEHEFSDLRERPNHVLSHHNDLNLLIG